ncbi:unnamed protein product [Rhizophagus irregularis]|nr:unnamed protein product [Rhizophagus irregularis]
MEKSKSDSHNEGSSKSVIEQRISLIQQNSPTQPSSSMTPTKNKLKFLLQNEENEERINENIEENEERNENIERK